MDFFFIDQMMDVGGIIVLDDVGYPAIRRACEFVLTNRQYEIADQIDYAVPGRWRRAAKAAALGILSPLVRTDRTPSPESQALEDRVSHASFVALRKTGEDSRRWDHYVPF